MYNTEERCPFRADETAYLNSQQYIYHHFALRQSECFQANHKNEGLLAITYLSTEENVLHVHNEWMGLEILIAITTFAMLGGANLSATI